MQKRIIGIDPGSEICGVCVLDDMQIIGAFNWNIPTLWPKISHFLIHRNLTVVMEDIRPYSIQLTPHVINTCKFIGEAVYRLRVEAGVPVELISRSEVKKWIFDTFPEVCGPMVKKKIDKKMFLACDVKTQEPVFVDTNGRNRRKQSFIFVDDRIVTESMKDLHKLAVPLPGKGYEFGLKDHSWQALAVASYFTQKEQKSASP